ncbi:MLO-like protein [Striga asiatica]|uniref:MLO-like protein n=1 Tax=Striga asiatica TaxID=4170 RepID=A0A5A7P970_STRAF|nr:MLO-like protein [Striga asiatica]
MAGGESGRPFWYTPTWVIAIVCFIIVFISLIAERALHNLGKCFKRKNQDSLYEALEKVKEELMLLGFISLLMTVFQVVYVFFCASTMVLGGIKAAFFKQFYGSVTRSDYIALRSGFIREHCPSNPNYNFHRYMLRTLEEDFRRIIGVSWYLWLFVVIFLLVNIAGWHTYFWLSFLPLILLLIVGAKLEYIITQLAKEAQESAEGTLVRPSDELFWFQQPVLVLYLIHFILFQNSFEIAFFLWIWSTYGFESCIMEKLNFIIPRIVVGIIVQVLCSYSTLPLYALVSQMSSMFKETLFAQFTKELLRTWASDTKHGSSRTNGSINRLTFESTNSTCLAQQMAMDSATTSSEIELSRPENISRPSSFNKY